MTTATLQPNTANRSIPSSGGPFDGVRAGLSGAETKGCIKWDLSSIPASAVVQSATLKVKISADNANVPSTLSVYRLKRNWTGSMTWTLYNGVDAWQTVGGSGANDIDTTPLGSVATGASDTGWRSIALTAAEVEKMVEGTYPNYGFMLRTIPSANDEYTYNNLSDGANAPILEVVYRLLSPAIMVWESE